MSHELAPKILEHQPEPTLAERFGSATAVVRSKLGNLACTGLAVTTGVFGVAFTTIVLGEASQPATASADTLGYPWWNAPCEWGGTTGSCSGYDWGEYSGTTFVPYRDGYEYRNCTDYVQWKIDSLGGDVPSNLGNGGQWYANAPSSERSLTPQAGDAAVEPGSVGHVAFIESVNSTADNPDDDNITVSEYNEHEDGTGDTRTGTASSMGFTEFVNFGVSPGGGSDGGGDGSGWTAGNSINWPDMTYLGTNTLSDGQYLDPGQYIMSPNGQFVLAMSSSGNIAEYSGSTSALWSTSENPGSDSAFVLQSDGNLVLYGPNNSVYWQSHTGGNGGDDLAIQNDGNVVIYAWNGTAIWASNTSGGFPVNNMGTNTLTGGESIPPGSALVSSDGRFFLDEQSNGDLVEYGPGYSLMWHSNTGGSSGAEPTLQSADGNFVIYNTSGEPIWASDTGGNSGDDLTIQNDGNVVIYAWDGTAIWASNT